MPAEGIVRATNPAPTPDPSFAVGREDRGGVSRFRRASLRAGVAGLLARSDGRAEESRLGQSVLHRRRGPISHSGQDVRIRVQRDGDRRVAEKLLYELGVNALR